MTGDPVPGAGLHQAAQGHAAEGVPFASPDQPAARLAVQNHPGVQGRLQGFQLGGETGHRNTPRRG